MSSLTEDIFFTHIQKLIISYFEGNKLVLQVQNYAMKNIFAFLLIFQISFGYAQAGNPASPYYDGFHFNQTVISLKNDLSNKDISTH